MSYIPGICRRNKSHTRLRDQHDAFYDANSQWDHTVRYLMIKALVDNVHDSIDHISYSYRYPLNGPRRFVNSSMWFTNVLGLNLSWDLTTTQRLRCHCRKVASRSLQHDSFTWRQQQFALDLYLTDINSPATLTVRCNWNYKALVFSSYFLIQHKQWRIRQSLLNSVAQLTSVLILRLWLPLDTCYRDIRYLLFFRRNTHPGSLKAAHIIIDDALRCAADRESRRVAATILFSDTILHRLPQPNPL